MSTLVEVVQQASFFDHLTPKSSRFDLFPVPDSKNLIGISITRISDKIDSRKHR